MRWLRMVVTVIVAMAAAALGPAAEAHAVPGGYGDFGFVGGYNDHCHVHMRNGNWYYNPNFYGVRVALFTDVIFADGDFCIIGKSQLRVGLHSENIILFDENYNQKWSMGSSSYVDLHTSYSFFQGFDGNFVQYSANNKVLGATNTCCQTDDGVTRLLAIQSDGNVVIYDHYELSNTYDVIWQTHTAH
ncbi:hypothetical protein GCM10010170_001460 [Dactylosporangium salmoneum]|uniref:Bulb-type lectin domain-containing protein n=2 Tax=Dactylosporangium salmoneum TaxID=53361 RepID=A0ABN3FBL7_9ACTN